MKTLIELCINKRKSSLLVFIIAIFMSCISYVRMPTELNPDIQIPTLSVSVVAQGLSSVDAERLVAAPMEEVLRIIPGVKQMKSISTSSRAYVMLEFLAGYDIKVAKEDVFARIDDIVAKLPNQAERPKVEEINMALFPVISVAVSGEAPEMSLITIAKKLKKTIESIPDVLEVKATGLRKNVVDVVIDPNTLLSYNFDLLQMIQKVEMNNVFVRSGNLSGNFALEANSVPANLTDIMNFPLVNYPEGGVLTLSEIAQINQSFEDSSGYARINGRPAVVLDVSKRLGTNIIDVIDQVKNIVSSQEEIPNVSVDCFFDQSQKVRDMLRDLENNILLAVIMVVFIVMAYLGTLPGVLVAISIPTSFLISILILNFFDATLNIVVLFSLIMSVGILVDSSIVINEYAERKMQLGMPRFDSYKLAAIKMCWPIISSTMTTLAVFLPLLFWPGVVGQFMKYMPITLITTLSSSLLVSLVLVPILSGVFSHSSKNENHFKEFQKQEFFTKSKYIQFYSRILNNIVLESPRKFILCSIGFLLLVICAYKFMGKGFEFFPSIEPDKAMVKIYMKGNITVDERTKVMIAVEDKINHLSDEIQTIYSKSGFFYDDVDGLIAVINLEFKDWRSRRKAKLIIDEIRIATKDIQGVIIGVEEEKKGPIALKPIKINLYSDYEDREALSQATQYFANEISQINGIIDVETDISAEMKWSLDIDKYKAMQFDLTVGSMRDYISMATDRGAIITKYRPDGFDEEVDVIARFPESKRNFSSLRSLLINTKHGIVPIDHFVTFSPNYKANKLIKKNGKIVSEINAGIVPGYMLDEQFKKIKLWFESNPFHGISFDFEGEENDKNEAKHFLFTAFSIALLMVVWILVTQFNSYYHTFVVMTSVVLSTAGTLLGLIITQQPFGIVMCGIGIIALSGIVINNNILLIEAFSSIVCSESNFRNAILESAVSRVRPILITAGTTVAGLVPMALGVNIDFLDREMTFGAPSSQWWTQLSTSIAFGLSFATIMTLFFTPALLMVKYDKKKITKNDS